MRALACTVLLALTSPVAAQDNKDVVTLTIAYPERDIAAKACAEAMIETQALVTQSFPVRVQIKPLTGSDDSDMALRIENKGSPFNLLEVPFAIRDAAHFMAYLQSDLGKQLFIDYGWGSTEAPLGYAYGGFSQVFSYDVAVTEPAHFNHRAFVGPSGSFLGKYDAIRPAWTTSQLLFGLGWSSATQSFYAEAGRRMAQDRSNAPAWRIIDGVDIVEAPLLAAFDINLDKNARFVSLLSSSLRLVYFGRPDWFTGIPDGLSRYQTQELRQKTIEWVNTAAPVCSAKVYDAELATLERLKKAGLQVVPFDRRALVDASWQSALTGPRNWTIAQADTLAKLGNPPPPVVLPSAILAKLPADQKRKAGEEDRSALARIDDRKQQEKDKGTWIGSDSVNPVNETKFNSLMGRAYYYNSSGETAKANEQIDEALKLKPSGDMFLARGDIFFARNDYDGAIREYSEGIRRLGDSASYAYYEHRGTAYSFQGAYARALADFVQITRPGNDFEAAVKSRRCFLYAVNGQFENAFADCTSALKENPFSPSALNARGFTYLKSGQNEKAIADYNEAIKVFPKFDQALYGRGLAKRKMGDTAGGDRDIAAAKAINANVADQFENYAAGGVSWIYR